MSFTSSELSQVLDISRTYVERVADLAQRICVIPAPTGDEWQRAEFVASLWRERRYVPEIDAVGNVYVRRGDQPQRPVLLLLAHTDTVFPASTPLKVQRDGDILRGPAIG